ncbi:hypothetical protein GGX14DRAFT_426352 [Mycena pura]|uniref:DUF6534 domain-containing protein n=1 Tax=Mycena pura TaxID=153505 RepID=A0AAD7E2G6_9AGAR|nr:hypothetical protein GGX14DRAFT_426352 [Mycena pura]
MSASAFPAPHDTLGAVEIGFIVSTFLFGIVTLQTFNYYRTYSDDSAGLKTLVHSCRLFEVGHSICGWDGVYSISVTFYGQPQHILDPPAVVGLLPLFTAIPILLVQWFFCLRIGRLSGRWHFARLLAFFCAIPTTLTMALVVMFQLGHGFATLEGGKGKLLMTIATSFHPPAHILLAFALCYSLWQFREPSEFEQPRDIVDNIIIWTVETTLLTCVFSFGYMILVMSWMAFYVVHPKRELNRRSALRKEAMRPAFRFALSDPNFSSGGQQDTTLEAGSLGKERARSASEMSLGLMK